MPGDDFMFMMKMPVDGSVGTERISSLSDFINSQINIFNTCHYRVLVHSLLQFFLLLPPWIFDLLNTVIFLWLIKLLIPEELFEKHQSILFILVFCFVWLFHPDIGNAYFWTTGSINYTWTLIPLMIYLRALVKVSEGKDAYSTLLYASPFVASANENALISLFVASVVLLLVDRRRQGSFNSKLLFAIAILLIGGLIMVFSPSATARLTREGSHFENLGYRVFEFGKRASYYALNYGFVLILFFCFKWKKLEWNKTAFLLLGIIILSLMSMLAVPLFEPRSSVFGFMVSVFMALYLMKDSSIVSSWPMRILLVLSVFIAMERGKNFKKLNENVNRNISLMVKNKGAAKLFLQPQCFQSQDFYSVCYEIDENENYINQSLEHYYRIGDISLDPQYSRKHNWDGLKSNWMKIDTLRFFDRITDEVYLKETKAGTHVIIDLGTAEFSPDKTTILRGKRRNNFKHILSSGLPVSIRMHFLDFLEYQSNYHKDGDPILFSFLDDHTYAYHLIYNPEDYERFYYSLYSLNNHKAEGAIKSFTLQ